jgi:hypothetical protein
MTGFAVVEALRIDAASHATARATQVSDAYGRARFAVATEESLERKYRLEPGPEVLTRFDRAAADYVAAINDVAKLGTTSDRVLVRSLKSRQRRYRTAISHLFAAVDSHNTRRVLDIDERQAEPLFATIDVDVDREPPRTAWRPCARQPHSQTWPGSSNSRRPSRPCSGWRCSRSSRGC